MANGHVRPGQSVTWRNETGAPVRSGALVPFGGGIAAKALQDIPAGQEGVVTLFQVHRFLLPPGVTFRPGELVFVANGEISASGDVLGRFIRLDEGGWAEVLIMPLAVGGGSGGSVPTLQQIVDGENGTSTITKTTGDGSSSRVTTSTTTIDAGSINQITTVEPVVGEQTPVKTYRGNLIPGGVEFTGPYKERSRNVSSVTLAAQDGKSFFNMNVGGNPGFKIEIEEEPTRRHVVALSTKLKDSFRQNLGIDTIDTRVTANETALADRYTKAQTDERIADALGNFDKLDYKVADSAPTPTTVVIDGKTETTQTGVRYMVKHQTDDRYEEYILIDGKIYDIGSTGEIDLSAYATTAAVNTALSGYATTEAMNTALAAKQNTLVSGTNLKTVAGASLLGSGNVPVSQVPTGGAAGQVLTKRTDADGDYNWQTQGAFTVDGDWRYKINPDNTFEAYYSKTGVTLTITEQSGNFYRSALQTLPLPAGIADNYAATPLHVSVNTSHNNYPCLGTLASVATNLVRYYALSGSSRGQSPNYIVTAHVFGTLAAKA